MTCLESFLVRKVEIRKKRREVAVRELQGGAMGALAARQALEGGPRRVLELTGMMVVVQD